MNRQKIYGIEVYSETKEKLMEEIEERMVQKGKFTLMSVNPEIILMSQKNRQTKETLVKSEINIPDGIGAILLAKKKGKEIKERITGFEMVGSLCELAVKRNESVFLYGAEEWVVEKAAENLKQAYPGLVIAGTQHGFVKNKELVTEKINEVEPDYLFVALGAPHQEKFIYDFFGKLNVHLIQTVGGSFDVWAGKVNRAPKWVQKINMEWLYRLLTDFKRLKRTGRMVLFLAKEMVKRGKSDE